MRSWLARAEARPSWLASLRHSEEIRGMLLPHIFSECDRISGGGTIASSVSEQRPEESFDNRAALVFVPRYGKLNMQPLELFQLVIH